MLSWGSRHKGLTVIVTVLASVCVAMLSIAWFTQSWVLMWKKAYVFLPSFIWSDLYVIFDALNCFNHGLTDFDKCPHYHSVYNYPVLWLQVFSALGLTAADANGVALCMMGIFFAAALALFWRATAQEGIIASIALVSPPVFLVIQRANCEELMFAIIVLACLLEGGKAYIFRTLLIFVAALLKLYPGILLVLFFFMARSAKERAMLIVAGLLFALYCFARFDEIAYIRRVTVPGVYPAFGLNVLPELFPFGHGFHVWLSFHSTEIHGAMAFCACIATGLLFFRKKSGDRIILQSVGDTAPMRCFLAGALIFVFMFFAQGNNWGYRLIYLIMCLPQALCWARADQELPGRFGRALTASLLFSLWAENFVPLVGEIMNWIVCLRLGTLLLSKAVQIAETQFPMALRRFSKGI